MDLAERDLGARSMRGRDLAGADLSGADLRGADLRGTDLGGSNLRRADLRGARTGAPPGWTALVTAGALALSAATGLAAGYGGRFVEHLLGSAAFGPHALGVVVVSMLAVFLLATVALGLGYALEHVLPVLASMFVIAWVVTLATGAGTGRGALAALVSLLLIAALVALSLVARAAAGGVRALAFVLVALVGAVSGALMGGGVISAMIAIGAMIAAQRALHGAHGYPWLPRLVGRVAAHRGTRLRDADLSGARLEDTLLQACDLRGAALEGAHLEGARLRGCLFDGEPPAAPRAKPSIAQRARATVRRLRPARPT